MVTKDKKKFYKKWRLWLIVIAIVVGVTSSGCSKDDAKVATNTKIVDVSTEKPKTEDQKEVKKENTNNETVEENTLKTNVSGELKVHYIDVGQADSILIQQGSNSMLIDAGNNPDSELVGKYISDQGISQLNYVIGTHPHEDHIGGLDYVINIFKVGKVYMPKRTATTKTFTDVVNAIKSKGLKITVPTTGESFKLGEATCAILAPNGSGYADANNESIVIKVTFGSNSFLFTGDAEDVSEKEMLSKGYELKTDILKIGHHGSSLSTTQEFLNKVSPKYAVISVGKDNSYGHPAKEAMDRLKAKKIPVYRTDELGTIIATSNGKDIIFNVKPGSYTFGSEVSKPKTSSNNEEVNTQTTKTDISCNGNNKTVYFTPSGKSYHYDKNCSTLKRSKTILEGTQQEAVSSGHADPCNICAGGN